MNICGGKLICSGIPFGGYCFVIFFSLSLSFSKNRHQLRICSIIARDPTTRKQNVRISLRYVLIIFMDHGNAPKSNVRGCLFLILFLVISFRSNVWKCVCAFERFVRMECGTKFMNNIFSKCAHCVLDSRLYI